MLPERVDMKILSFINVWTEMKCVSIDLEWKFIRWCRRHIGDFRNETTKVRISRTTTEQETREETQLKMMAILFCSRPSCFAVERMQSHDEWIFDKKLWQKPTFSLCSRAYSVDARSGWHSFSNIKNCNVFHSVGSLQFLLLLFRQFCSFRCRSLFSTRVSLGQYDLCCAASTILPRFKYLWT